MSLNEADTFFQEATGTKADATVFFARESAVDTTKEIIAIALAGEGDKVKITFPLDEDGMANEDNVAVSKEDAEKYIEKYKDEEFEGIYQRCLDFYSDKENRAGRTLWLETYERAEGCYDAAHVLTWCGSII